MAGRQVEVCTCAHMQVIVLVAFWVYTCSCLLCEMHRCILHAQGELLILTVGNGRQAGGGTRLCLHAGKSSN